MRLPRRDIDPYAVLAQLDPTLAGALLVEVGEGWDNVAWSLETGDEPLILRIGKLTDQAEQGAVTTTDAALLEFVGAHSSLTTNHVLAFDPGAGALLLTQVPGVPANLVAVTDSVSLDGTLGVFLRRLHAAEPPAGLVESGSQALRLRERTTAAFVTVADRVEPAGRSGRGRGARGLWSGRSGLRGTDAVVCPARRGCGRGRSGGERRSRTSGRAGAPARAVNGGAGACGQRAGRRRWW
ncbi:MAG TPA: hypothetical protein PKH97_05560 [Tetrasphaera sp.]|uniref:hypothetical protein n=1 Tax=Nostocoides sp. TaxID=1917966 RepID=UPI002B643B9C|nr:hypothetical protein [Tetrasphaera sp.]HNQ06638.1 hypothetical protein [Tetrasphaera sp.]